MTDETCKNTFEKWIDEVEIVKNAEQRINPLPNSDITIEELTKYIFHTTNIDIKKYCSYALLYSNRVLNLEILFYILETFSLDPFIVLLVIDRLTVRGIEEDEYYKLVPISKILNSNIAINICNLRILQSLKKQIKGNDTQLDEAIFLKILQVEL